jgi:hypothetical protein
MNLSFPVSILLLLSACGGGEPAEVVTSTASVASSSADGEVAASADFESKEGSDEVLVQIEDAPITVAEFKAAAARKMPASGDALSMEEKKEVLDSLVSDRLLYLNGLALGVDKDPKVQKVVVNTLLRDVVYAEVRNGDFPEADLRAYYEENRNDFIIQAKVQLKTPMETVRRRRSVFMARSLPIPLVFESLLQNFPKATSSAVVAIWALCHAVENLAWTWLWWTRLSPWKRRKSQRSLRPMKGGTF